MNNASLVNQTSAESGFEYYTPSEWTDAAREVMGGIDLDPASCKFANQWIGASRFFTKENNGLQQEWHGRVWMNHPFHRGETACKAKCKKLTCQRRGHHIAEDIPGNADWINKLQAEYQAGRVTEAVIICYCSSSETWFKPLLKQPQCFPDGRIHYIGEDGKKVQGNTKGSVITYFGPNVAKFAEVFGKLGEVKVAYQPGDQLTGISTALVNMIEQRARELTQQYASATIEQWPDHIAGGDNDDQTPEIPAIAHKWPVEVLNIVEMALDKCPCDPTDDYYDQLCQQVNSQLLSLDLAGASDVTSIVLDHLVWTLKTDLAELERGDTCAA